MSIQRMGVIMNGVTGRMGARQHLERSILAIRKQGGVALANGESVVPDPILVGRNEEKLKALSDRHGGLPYSTDLETVLGDREYPVYFDSQPTALRFVGVSNALAAGKHVYCEKPVAHTLQDAVAIFHLAQELGLKNGVVQDKLFLPGVLKLRRLLDEDFFGQVLSVRGEFGYWVFVGDQEEPQRPSWNYVKSQGGGLVLDMFPHWRYLIDDLFGPITSMVSMTATHVKKRWDENGNEYACTAEDAAYAMFQTETGILCQFNTSWCTRVRRDDLLTIQVDGTEGSAVVGLRKCFIQPLSQTPRPVWNPDEESGIDYTTGWSEYMPDEEYENAFKVQWERFIRHVAADEPFPWTLSHGAKGVQLAELAHQSWRKHEWVNVTPIKGLERERKEEWR